MRLWAALGGKLDEHMLRERRAIERAVPEVIRREALALKEEMRRQSRAGGFRGGVVKSWTAKFYENRRVDAAAVVYSRAPKIMLLAEEGGTVRPKRGRYLIIRLAGAGKARGGRPIGGLARRLHPRDVMGLKTTRWIKLSGGRILIVRETRTRSMPLFLLVRSTRHKKKIDFAGAARRTGDRVPVQISERLPRD